jgi:hypothetical protein
LSVSGNIRQHSYLAKFYGLCLLAAVAALLIFDASGWVIVALAAVALVTNFEILVIQCLAKSPRVDVRSVFTLRTNEGQGIAEQKATRS